MKKFSAYTANLNKFMIFLVTVYTLIKITSWTIAIKIINKKDPALLYYTVNMPIIHNVLNNYKNHTKIK